MKNTKKIILGIILGTIIPLTSFATTLPSNVILYWNGVNFMGTGTPLLTAGRFLATTSIASIFPYSSSTALTVSGQGYFGSLFTTGSTTLQNFTARNATTTNATSTTVAVSSSLCIAGDCRSVWPSSGGTPGGSNTQVQFNDSSAFGGSSNFTFDKNKNILYLDDTPALGYNAGITWKDNGVTANNFSISADGAVSKNANGINIFTGGITGNGNGGAIAIEAGNLFDITGTGNGGPVTVSAGNGGLVGGNGADVTLNGGSGQAGNGNGGSIILQAGVNDGSGAPGNIEILSGNGTNYAILDTSLVASSDKTFTFPNQSGTLCLTTTCTGGGIGDPFTHPSSGVSATTSQINMGNLLVTASSTLQKFTALAGTTTQLTIRNSLAMGTTTPLKLFDIFGNQSGGIGRFTRSTAGTSAGNFGVLDLAFQNTSTGQDNLGPSQTFSYINQAGTINSLASIQGVRYGADTDGLLRLTASSASNSQVLTIDGIGGVVAVGSTTPGSGASDCGANGFCVVNQPNSGPLNAEAQIKEVSGTGTDQVRTFITARSNITPHRSEIGAETNSPFGLFTNNLLRMMIDTTGYVGIGSTTPFALLSINPTAGSPVTDSPAFVIGSSTATTFSVTPFGSGDLLDIGTTTTATNSLVFTSQSFLGLGTTTPFATLSVESNSPTGDIFALATTTGATIGGYDNDGHRFTSGPAGAVSSCGTGSGSVVGDDQGGTITTATAATACTYTFAKAYRATPVCTVTDNSLVGFADISSISTSAVTFGISSALTGGNLYYSCSYHR